MDLRRGFSCSFFEHECLDCIGYSFFKYILKKCFLFRPCVPRNMAIRVRKEGKKISYLMLSPQKKDFFPFWRWNNCVSFFVQAATSNYLRTHYLTFPFFFPRKKRGKFRASLCPHVSLLSSTHRRLKPSCPDATFPGKRNGIFVGTVPPPPLFFPFPR